MLRVKTITKEAAPTRETIDIWGESIPVWIRPWDVGIAKEIRNRHIKGFEWIPNPVTGRKEKQEIINSEAFFNDTIDYVIADFEDIGDEDGTPWPVDLEHKKRLTDLAQSKGEESVWDKIFERAKALAFAHETEAQEQEKNLSRPQPGATATNQNIAGRAKTQPGKEA